MQKKRRGCILEADIHGMTEAEAKKALEQLLSAVPKGISEIDVIHGYQGGTVLQKMVRQKLKHHRIARKILGLNPGVTELMLLPPEEEKPPEKGTKPPRR